MKTYYHITYPDNVEAIHAEGLLAGWEGVYLTDNEEHAITIMAHRLGHRVVGYKNVPLSREGAETLHPDRDFSDVADEDLPTAKFPDVRNYDTFVVFTISGLDEANIEESFDHTADFFGGAKAYIHRGHIDPKFIDRTDEYDIDPDRVARVTRGLLK